MTALTQHQVEIERNLHAWKNKPLLQKLYAGFYGRIVKLIDRSLSGAVLEIGSGIGNLKTRLPDAITTDLFPNPWLDLVCDGYELPFQNGTVSHVVLFDVFHHLRAPLAFFHEARRVLQANGRVILFEPYISALSYPVYGLLHHEAVALRGTISSDESLPRPRGYYAAQGNATRIFFGGNGAVGLEDWKILHAERFAAFSYLLSGGFSKPAAYPQACLPMLARFDELLSAWPRVFGGRCLVAMTPKS